jgi:uncharacterized protein YuzE
MHALAIQFVAKPKSVRTEEVFEGVNLDFNAKGKLVAIEVIDASRFAAPEKLSELPSARQNHTLAQASKESGLEPDSLRLLIHKERCGPRGKAGTGKSPETIFTPIWSLEAHGAVAGSASWPAPGERAVVYPLDEVSASVSAAAAA